MLVFLLFSVINLCVGFGAAVLLGYGPKPWYALFLPAGGDEVVQIDVLEAEGEPTAKAEPEEKPAEKKPPMVSHPFPEMNEPEDIPEASAESETSEPSIEELVTEEEEPEPEVPAEPEAKPEAPVAKAAVEAVEDEEHELEDFLAGRREEPKDEEPTNEEASEVASADDIASMFASAKDAPKPKAEAAPADSDTKAEEEELEDKPLNQDDIAALFNS